MYSDLKTTLIWASALGLILISTARAQLAITEVMSSASTNHGPNLVSQNSDFWELTNFGTNVVNLNGFKFDDSDNNLVAADPTPFAGLLIGPDESIVFVQNNVNTNELAFRTWWGTNLPAGLKVVFYTGNGLSSGGDGIRLWGPDAADVADVVDSVDFGEAVRGSSFTYDPTTGDFGVLSTNHLGGAFVAEMAEDIGSPGRTTGPTPLQIVQQPVDMIVNPGDTAKFTVRVQGRPRGTLQWYYKDAPVPGATKATLQITDTQAAVTGDYYVEVDNGISKVKSVKARLVLQSEAAAPTFTLLPSDLEMYVGQSFAFRAAATGVPQPTYQWQANGSDLEGAQTAELTLAGVTEQQSGLYAVIARNAVGAATNTFRVTVTPKPKLAITEVMSSASTNTTAHSDWWELTNLDSFSVRLKGYRFDDNSETLAASYTFTNDITFAAGESVIFVESMTPDEFREWWGPEFLDPNLQIVTYRGNGLSSLGDAVNVWNAAASEDSDKVASAVFSTGTLGVSFGYSGDAAQFGSLSIAGEQGAFVANSGGDIGSPGYVRNAQRVFRPRLKEIASDGATVRMTWSSQLGKTYLLQAKANLNELAWTTLKTVTAAQAVTGVDQPVLNGASRQFYRVVAQP